MLTLRNKYQDQGSLDFAGEPFLEGSMEAMESLLPLPPTSTVSEDCKICQQQNLFVEEHLGLQKRYQHQHQTVRTESTSVGLRQP